METYISTYLHTSQFCTRFKFYSLSAIDLSHVLTFLKVLMKFHCTIMQTGKSTDTCITGGARRGGGTLRRHRPIVTDTNEQAVLTLYFIRGNNLRHSMDVANT